MVAAAVETEIFVSLANEGTDVWRPVRARHLSGDQYEILPQSLDLEDEEWEFPPGSRVRCEKRQLSGNVVLTAVALLDHAV